MPATLKSLQLTHIAHGRDLMILSHTPYFENNSPSLYIESIQTLVVPSNLCTSSYTPILESSLGMLLTTVPNAWPLAGMHDQKRSLTPSLRLLKVDVMLAYFSLLGFPLFSSVVTPCTFLKSAFSLNSSDFIIFEILSYILILR